jgi:ubiquinone/menaquinone biosynthesis C-methylase UbiE
MMTETSRTYVPAAGRDWLLPLYDPIVKLLGGHAARKALLDQAGLLPDHRVLEIGCGTGTLAIQVKKLHPRVAVVGLDPDPKALARARRKAVRAAVSIQFEPGFADELPYPEASFDRVFSCFMFHHLPAEEKEPTLREARRVLKAGGEFHMLDFEGPEDSAHGFMAHFFHSSDRLKGNSEGRVINSMRHAGFADPRKVGRRTMLFGGVAYYRART